MGSFDPMFEKSIEGIQVATQTTEGLLHVGANMRGFFDRENIDLYRFTNIGYEGTDSQSI